MDRCGTCHMAYILIFSIFLPSLNNNTILIFSPYFIKHTLASFFKFSCISATESLPGIYKPPELSQILQSSTCLHLDNTSPRLVSTFTSIAPGLPMPSRPLLSLYRLARVHQEDRSSSLARSRPLLKNVLSNAPSVSSQHLVAIVIHIATFWLPSSSTSQHSGCPSHLTTQDLLSKCTPKNVLSKCKVKLVLQASSLLTSSHSGQACHCGAVS